MSMQTLCGEAKMPWSDPEIRKEYSRRYYQNNKQKWVDNRKPPTDEQRDLTRRWSFEYRLKTVYGMSRVEYDALLNKQQGRCAVCGTKEVKGIAKQMHVDHCHVSGKIRGLLCMRCNTALGWYEKNAQAVINYLQSSQ